MEEELFEDLLESVAEAGAVLRGEWEAARHTTLGEGDGPARERRGPLVDAGLEDSET